MKKIIFLAAVGALLMQGCQTPASSWSEKKASSWPAPIELDPVKIMSSPNIGNCLACHTIPAKPEMVAGNMGPPFVGMKDRFPDIAKLRVAIADQKAISSETIMPPFGRNKLLTPAQIDVIAQYIYQY